MHNISHQYDLIDIESESEKIYGIHKNQYVFSNKNISHNSNTFKARLHNNTLTNSSTKSDKKPSNYLQKSFQKPNRLHSCQLSTSSSLTTLTSALNYENNTFHLKDDLLKSLNNFKFYGKCVYGDVYTAKSELSKIKLTEGRATVALKIFRNVRHEQSTIEFHRDIETYSKLSHENIVKIIDICTNREHQAPNILILEHTEYGELKELLVNSSYGEKYLSIMQKLQICQQIASAMQHFEQKLLMHGDIAARNCIVYLRKTNSNISPFIHVKVSNLSLCGDKYANEYTYLSRILRLQTDFQNDDVPIPIRWMAPEALLENKLSIKSDVYSYGVTCWEIWKDGQLPYEGLSDLEVYQTLKNFDLYRLESLSDLCPPEIWTLIEKCWLESIEARPTFYDCVKVLNTLFEDIS